MAHRHPGLAGNDGTLGKTALNPAAATTSSARACSEEAATGAKKRILRNWDFEFNEVESRLPPLFWSAKFSKKLAGNYSSSFTSCILE